jgi:hypothetical protein
MRRLLSVTAVTAALLFGAGCSADNPAGTTAAGTPAASGAAAPAVSSAPSAPGAGTPSVPSGGDAALSGNTGAICQQAAKTGGEAAKNFAQDLKLLIDAETAQDADQVAKVKAKTTRDVENYSYALRDMAKLAADPKLKAALADMGQQVTALQGDVLKIDAAQLTKLQDTLDQACGAG